MKRSIIVSILALVLLTACSAFDNSSELDNGMLPNLVPSIMANGQFEGVYSGEMVLTENNCTEMTEAVDSTTELKIDVLQSGDLVSVAFEDESESSGSLKDNKTVVVKRGVSETHVFQLEFAEDGVTGTCDYIETAPTGNMLGEPCAFYSLELSKE